MPDQETEVGIVGGGLAGGALATRLADAGMDVVVFERLQEPRWRACGVYSSPLTHGRLSELGLEGEGLAALVRPIGAMEVRSTRGSACRLAYDPPACGLARPALDRALLDRARRAGARVVAGTAVLSIERGHRDGAPIHLAVASGTGSERWRCRLVVGADGPGSMVARAFGVDRPVRRLRHAGLTVHRPDPDGPSGVQATSARMIIGNGWYCGVAPVPGERVNIGIVMGERMLRERLRADGGVERIVAGVVARLPLPDATWRITADADAVRTSLPLAHRVARRAGRGFLLIGDAAGFVDPLSGDGIHRALWSAELAAAAIVDEHEGRSDGLARYDARMRSTFGPKDLLSWVLQLFLARPALLDYGLRRLARRASHRETFASVLADLVPARRALEPGYLLGLLAP
jgi:flavin-dependent dehydrogenase